MASFRRIPSQRQKQHLKSQKRRQLTKQDNIFQMFILGVILLIIVVAFIQRKATENFNDIKQDKGSYLVYTKFEDKSTTYIKEVPYINLKADIFKQVNADILKFCNPYMNSKKSIITYEYDINGIILSVVIKVINNEASYAPEPYFRTYNINLKTQEVIADDALLQYFGVTKRNVETKIKRGFQNFYADLVKERYYATNECSYDCFLKYRGVTNYLDYVSYYIKDGKLIAYKTFIAHSIFGEEEYFTDEDFEFEIADAPVEETEVTAPLSSESLNQE